jgi:hypothetical protein
VIGRVGVFIPHAGYLLTLYSAPSGILFTISLGLVLLVLGVLLEPFGVRPAAAPVSAPSTVANPVFKRAGVKEVVNASRERRARRTRWGTQGSRRPEPGA